MKLNIEGQPHCYIKTFVSQQHCDTDTGHKRPNEYGHDYHREIACDGNVVLVLELVLDRGVWYMVIVIVSPDNLQKAHCLGFVLCECFTTGLH